MEIKFKPFENYLDKKLEERKEEKEQEMTVEGWIELGMILLSGFAAGRLSKTKTYNIYLRS